MIDNPHLVEQEILRLSEKLDTATQEMATRSRAFADADAAYQVAYAQAKLQVRDAERGLSRGERSTVDEVEARAAIATQAEYRAKLHAEALLKTVQEAGRNRRAQLDALRSIAANVRHLIGAA